MLKSIGLQLGFRTDPLLASSQRLRDLILRCIVARTSIGCCFTELSNSITCCILHSVLTLPRTAGYGYEKADALPVRQNRDFSTRAKSHGRHPPYLRCSSLQYGHKNKPNEVISSGLDIISPLFENIVLGFDGYKDK